jgi:hypothetical protein
MNLHPQLKAELALYDLLRIGGLDERQAEETTFLRLSNKVKNKKYGQVNLHSPKAKV